MPAALFVAASALLAGTLHGTVARWPTMPVCRVGTPCSAPAPHVALVFTRGARVRRVETDRLGRYRAVLAAGTWSVRAPAARLGFEPATVVVAPGPARRVDFTIDTGIR